MRLGCAGSCNLSDIPVGVLLNNGDGTFQARVDYATGDAPQWVTAADLDGDSYPDLAVTNPGSNTVSVLLNRAGD